MSPSDNPLNSDDQAWVHWEYSPEEWALFEQFDLQPARRKFWLNVGFSSPVFLDLAVIVCIPILSSVYHILPLNDIFALPIFSILIVPFSLALMFLESSRKVYDQAKKRHKARQQNRFHRVTIAEKGVWEAGTYFPFDNLIEVKMTPEPPVLHFRRTTPHSGIKNKPLTNALSVLVPRGHEEEAAQLVQRFRTEVIEAREQARQRVINPPEPV